MKFYLDDELLFEVRDIDRQVFSNNFPPEVFHNYMAENVKQHLSSFFDSIATDIKNKWLPVLFQRMKSIPTDTEELLNLIFSQPDYKNFEGKAKDQKAKNEAKATEV